MASEIKWIKLAVDIFDNRKIKQIEKLPEGDTLIVIWLKLLVLAGVTNDGGMVYFTREIPYTDQLLANEFGRPLATIQLALSTFERFRMIEILDDVIHISNWEKYQSVEQMNIIREQTNKRVAAYRERKRLESGKGCNVTCNVTCNATVTHGNATEEDIDIDKENKNKSKNTVSSPNIDSVKEESVSPHDDADSIQHSTENDSRDVGVDKDTLIAYATNNLRYLSPMNVEELDSFRDSLTDEMIQWAIDYACAAGNRTYRYVRGILNNMVERGFKTLGDVKAAEEKRRREKEEAKAPAFRRDDLEDWGTLK